MGTFTAATAIPTGGLITSAWMTNNTADINFLGAAGGTTIAKDLAFIRRATSQSISGWTIISFDAEDIDAANGHSTTAPYAYRYTAVAAGKYRLTGACAIAWTGASSPVLGCQFQKNGVAITGSTAYRNPYNAVNETMILPTTYVSLAVGDYVAMAVNVTGSATSPIVDPSSGAVQMGVEWCGI